MKSITIFTIFLIIATGLSGCLEESKEQAQQQPTEQPIDMVITFTILQEFCTENGYTESRQYSDDYSHTRGGTRVGVGMELSSGDTTVTRACYRTVMNTISYPISELNVWLVSTGVISKDQQVTNISDQVYNVFCQQKGSSMAVQVGTDSIDCGRNLREEKIFSGQEIAKWFLRQGIKI